MATKYQISMEQVRENLAIKEKAEAIKILAAIVQESNNPEEQSLALEMISILDKMGQIGVELKNLERKLILSTYQIP